MNGAGKENDESFDQAIAWQHALAGDDPDWDAYMGWLEADPRHRRAVDQLALLDRAIDEHGEVLRAPDAGAMASRRSRWLRACAGVAAGLLLAVGAGTYLGQDRDQVYAADAASSRRIVLTGGVAVDLAPGSQLTALEGKSNRLRLDRGEGYFSVRHDPARTLSIAAGGYEIHDIGTEFAVKIGGGNVSVAVAAGQVAVDADRLEPTRLAAGQLLNGRYDGSGGNILAVHKEDVGSWRHGRLVYADAPLPDVAADLARFTNHNVTIDPELRGKTFSGVLIIGDGSRAFQNLAEILGAGISEQGREVHLSGVHHR
ncbi:FecR domain-containing protein [uncultured Sphingomonas sp.]|uniref:FecR family protein n=1 Tax=uncultured Sphingomonas sp. TaxID=158754 RepID=UPI00261EC411|nr:FecR domain-containing protein [uncultured Sphingomonas sp.]